MSIQEVVRGVVSKRTMRTSQEEASALDTITTSPTTEIIIVTTITRTIVMIKKNNVSFAR